MPTMKVTRFTDPQAFNEHIGAALAPRERENNLLLGIVRNLVAKPDDAGALAELAARVDLVTYEFENVPAVAARSLAERVPVYPSPAALEVSQDRLHEKALFGSLGIPTAPFAPVDSVETLTVALDSVGVPAVLKTRRLGYDGKGQRIVRTAEEARTAWAALGRAPCVLEGFVRFTRELSCLAVRGREGVPVVYPLVENHHEGGILRRSIAPAPGVTSALQARAAAFVGAIAEHTEDERLRACFLAAPAIREVLDGAREDSTPR